MADSRKRVDVRLGAFACSIEGYDDPAEQFERILSLVRQAAEASPAFADTALRLEPGAIDTLSGSLDEKAEDTSGLIIVRQDAEAGMAAEEVAPEDTPAEEVELVRAAASAEADEADFVKAAVSPEPDEDELVTESVGSSEEAEFATFDERTTAEPEPELPRTEPDLAEETDDPWDAPPSEVAEPTAKAATQSDNVWANAPADTAQAEAQEHRPEPNFEAREASAELEPGQDDLKVPDEHYKPEPEPEVQTLSSAPVDDFAGLRSIFGTPPQRQAREDLDEPKGRAEQFLARAAAANIFAAPDDAQSEASYAQSDIAPSNPDEPDASIAPIATLDTLSDRPNIFADPEVQEPALRSIFADPVGDLPDHAPSLEPPEPAPSPETYQSVQETDQGASFGTSALVYEQDEKPSPLTNIFGSPEPAEVSDPPLNAPEDTDTESPEQEPAAASDSGWNMFGAPPASDRTDSSDVGESRQPSFAAPSDAQTGRRPLFGRPKGTPAKETGPTSPEDEHIADSAPSSASAPEDVTEPEAFSPLSDDPTMFRNFSERLARGQTDEMIGAPGTPEQNDLEAQPAPKADQGVQSAAALAASAGAISVPELLAASAAWLTIAENTDRFTRRQVMGVFDTIPGDHPRTLEARIRGYGELVRNKTVVLVDDGYFALSDAERERYRQVMSQS